MTNKHSKFWIGTSGWMYDDWIKVFYPKCCAKKEWLHYYAQHFSTVEVNATFYRSFPKATYQHWYNIVPSQFRYVIKLSKYITHRKYLLNVKTSIHHAENTANVLHDKLGLILMQLPPNMPYDLQRLQTTLDAFHDPSKVVVEFRNSKWLTEETLTLLTNFKAIFCNVDGPDSRVNEWLTSNIGYIRLHGRKQMYKYNYTKVQLMEIAENAQNLVKKGAKEVYIFFNNDYEAQCTSKCENFNGVTQ